MGAVRGHHRVVRDEQPVHLGPVVQVAAYRRRRRVREVDEGVTRAPVEHGRLSVGGDRKPQYPPGQVDLADALAGRRVPDDQGALGGRGSVGVAVLKAGQGERAVGGDGGRGDRAAALTRCQPVHRQGAEVVARAGVHQPGLRGFEPGLGVVQRQVAVRSDAAGQAVSLDRPGGDDAAPAGEVEGHRSAVASRRPDQVVVRAGDPGRHHLAAVADQLVEGSGGPAVAEVQALAVADQEARPVRGPAHVPHLVLPERPARRGPVQVGTAQLETQPLRSTSEEGDGAVGRRRRTPSRAGAAPVARAFEGPPRRRGCRGRPPRSRCVRRARRGSCCRTGRAPTTRARAAPDRRRRRGRPRASGWSTRPIRSGTTPRPPGRGLRRQGAPRPAGHR